MKKHKLGDVVTYKGYTYTKIINELYYYKAKIKKGIIKEITEYRENNKIKYKYIVSTEGVYQKTKEIDITKNDIDLENKKNLETKLMYLKQDVKRYTRRLKETKEEIKLLEKMI